MRIRYLASSDEIKIINETLELHLELFLEKNLIYYSKSNNIIDCNTLCNYSMSV